MTIRICELYSSVQGEGLLTGTPSVFVRTSGCNLRCSFCDTPFASWKPEGDSMTVQQIVDAVMAESSRHVVITGGEPMIQNELPELCSQLSVRGRHITIETAGTVMQELHCDLMSISPKMSNSTPSEQAAGDWSQQHEQRRYQPSIVADLIEQALTTDEADYQLKFVVDEPGDIDEIVEFVSQVESADYDRVLLMPQGVEEQEIDQRAQWLMPLCQQRGFRYCDRLHLRWFGNTRGT